MNSSIPPKKELWTGRNSGMRRYMHEVVKCVAPEEVSVANHPSYGILGYCCEEGVRRNFGRIGTAEGPDIIRQQLAKLPAHFPEENSVLDFGNIACNGGDMETAQLFLAGRVEQLLDSKIFPILLGGGHDIAYGHYLGIMSFLKGHKTLGIINLDAHFDLRANTAGNNSGTPFYQIAERSKDLNIPFKYMCLGIREDANDSALFSKAKEYGVNYIKTEDFGMHRIEEINKSVLKFISEVDYIYLTIDLDGFSSAYAPGVSAASPLGFAPDIALKTMRTILQSGKVISSDIAEMNPAFDRDHQTAKLAASLIHFVLHQ